MKNGFCSMRKKNLRLGSPHRTQFMLQSRNETFTHRFYIDHYPRSPCFFRNRLFIERSRSCRFSLSRSNKTSFERRQPFRHVRQPRKTRRGRSVCLRLSMRNESLQRRRHCRDVRPMRDDSRIGTILHRSSRKLLDERRMSRRHLQKLTQGRRRRVSTRAQRIRL